MWRALLITAATAAGLSLTVAGVHAQNMGVGAQGGANVNAGVNARTAGTTARTQARVNTRTTATARAQARGPESRPPGWSHGRKTGWHCRVGTRGCIPPGLR